MVEKRTLVFATLAMLVWASIATSLAGYYYMEYLNRRYQLSEKLYSMNELANNYDESVTKWNLLAEEFGGLHGDYQWFTGDNYGTLMNRYVKLLDDLKGNYTELLSDCQDLNETYNNLWNKSQTLSEQPTVTKEEFGQLLDEFYILLTSLAMRELGKSTGVVITLKANLCIDYGNTTVVWYNDTSMPPGSTLYDLTQKVALVEPKYYPTMAPGHILITSINGYADGYWLWYYWDEERSEWIFGPVGCDAWMLKNGGVYKWVCSSW